MDKLISVISTALPVFLALAIGMMCRSKGFLNREGVDTLKKVIVNLTLPFVLFTETVDFGNLAACWLPLGFAGVLSMGVAYSLQIVGQKSLEPTTASLIMSLESVFAVIGGWWLLGERMTPWEAAGCVLVFAAVVISQLPERRK